GFRRRAHRLLHGGAAAGGRRHRSGERERGQRASALQEAPAPTRPAAPLAGPGGAEAEAPGAGRVTGPPSLIRGGAAVAVVFLPACPGWRPVVRVSAPELFEQPLGVTAV